MPLTPENCSLPDNNENVIPPCAPQSSEAIAAQVMLATYPTDDKYILRGREIIKVNDLLEWAQWFEHNREARQVAFSELYNSQISTVFVGLDMRYGRMAGASHGPLLFETYVNGGDMSGLTYRYATYEEAEYGHEEVLHKIRSGILKGNHIKPKKSIDMDNKFEPTTEVLTPELANAQELLATGKNLDIPSIEGINDLLSAAIGAAGNAITPIHAKVNAGNEHFWVLIEKLEGDYIYGRVDNDLVRTHMHNLKYEDYIRFQRHNIYSFM